MKAPLPDLLNKKTQPQMKEQSRKLRRERKSLEVQRKDENTLAALISDIGNHPPWF